MLPFARVTIIGLGLIGSSLARAIRAEMPPVRVTGYDADPAVRDIARRIDLADDVTEWGHLEEFEHVLKLNLLSDTKQKGRGIGPSNLATEC